MTDRIIAADLDTSTAHVPFFIVPTLDRLTPLQFPACVPYPLLPPSPSTPLNDPYPPEFDPYEGPRLSPRGIHGETVTQSAQSLSHSTLVLMSSVLVCCASFRSYANAHNAQVIFVWALPL